MDKKRVIEIMDSLGVIDVECKGKPVWIESIRSNGQAKVRDLNEENELLVDISDLQEVDSHLDM
ncbi:H-type small acid-soluble spore protein [Clostridium oryzae]|uniref:Small, acid-soluble spore protein H n=1 Tax=Clostridium oryzae TaxID=1450648 RepID=A0A1V4IKG3_9CLOT|nr:H-type small acid-soluble spore protein [Clostridium oryzae]OPJ60511.1 small, acid-soluble spore protein H [Clostridium oryzae]